MVKQYIVQKYVMANSAKEAEKKSKRIPIHEVFVHNPWFEKVAGFEWTETKNSKIGFKKT